MLSFYHGEKNQEKLKKLVALSLEVILGISAVTAAASFLLCLCSGLNKLVMILAAGLFGMAIWRPVKEPEQGEEP